MGNWFGIVEFTDKLRKVYRDEIQDLIKVFGKGEELEVLLGRKVMQPKPGMNKYRVHVCRVAYSHLDIEVEAFSENDAKKLAYHEAGNRSFPIENSSEYSVEGCTLVK